MSDDQQSFERFLERRKAAALAFVRGDGAPVSQLSTANNPATFFGPRGGQLSGGAEIRSRYQLDASLFETGSDNTLEILHASASAGIGYWVGFQRTQARMKRNPKPVPMNLRVTEIFRREDGDWKLIHRHADMLAEPQG